MSTVRSVKVVLTADASQAINETRRFGNEMEAAGARAERSGRRSDRAWDLTGKAAGRAAVAGVAALGVIGKAGMDFEKAISSVSAATNAGERDLGRLRQASIEAGADTQYSATEAAKGVTELAKAGVDTQEILGGGLTGALSLAAAGQIEVADAAQIAASAMTQFKLEGSEVPRVADLLAAGAGKAQGGVDDLSMALAQGGLVAAQTGLSIEETVAGLTSFASAGLLGSDAGTSFKTMLMSLNPRSKEAAVLMDEYNIQAYDAQGNFVGLADYAGRLRNGLKDMTTEQRNATLQTIFGSDAIRAAQILYNQGARGVEQWTKKVDDQGYAAKTAAKQTDNLAGDIERLKGSLESAFIKGGGGLQDGLRDITQGAERLVDKFGDLPDAVQENSVKAVAKLTAAGGLLWALSKARTTMAGLRGPTGGTRAGGLAGAAASGPVPVFVTNWGAGTPGGPGRTGTPVPVGGPGTKATPVAAPRTRPTARVSAAAAGARLGASLFPATAAAVLTASISESLDDIGAKGPETAKKFYKGFEKEKGGLSKALFGPGNTLTADFDRAITTLNNGSLGKLDETLDRTFSFTSGTSFTKGLDNVRALDTQLAGLAKTDRAQAWDVLNDIVGRTGQSLFDVTSVLPKTNDQLRNTGKAAVNIGSFLAQSVIPGFQAYQTVLRGVPERVVTEVAAKGADLTVRNVRQLKRQYDLTPKQVETLMGLVGDGPTRQKLRDVMGDLRRADQTKAFPQIGQVGAEKVARDIRDVLGNLNVLDRGKASPRIQQQGAGNTLVDIRSVSTALGLLNGKTATTYVKTVRLTGGVVGGARPIADGGTVPGQRYPYGDKVLTYLAPGEEVITNRAGQADRFRADRAAGRIPAYANGGTVLSSSWPQALAGGGTVRRRPRRGGGKGRGGNTRASKIAAFEKAIDKATDALDRETQQRDDLIAKRDDLRAAVTSSMLRDAFALPEAPAVAATPTYDDIWSPTGMATATKTRTELAEPAAPPFTAAYSTELVKANTASIRQFRLTLEALQGLGLDGEAFEAVARSAADGDFTQATALAASGRGGVQAWEAAFNERAAEAAALSSFAGNAVYGAGIAAENEDIAAIRAELSDLNASLKGAQKDASKDRKDAPGKTGKAAAAGANKAVGAGRRRRRATGRKVG